MFHTARYGGFAAAASAVVVIGAWLFVTDSGGQVACGDVVKNVEQAKSVTFRNKQKIGQQPEMEMQWRRHYERSHLVLPGTGT